MSLSKLECNICKRLLPVSDFHKKQDGGVGKSCENCFKKQAEAKKRACLFKTTLNGNKRCERCGLNKPLFEFAIGDGRIRKICKECDKSKIKKKYTFQNAAPTTPFIPDIDINQPIDLSFLADLGGFSEQEIKRLLITVNTYSKDPHFLDQLTIFQKYFPHRKPKVCRQLVQEFTEVYRAGIEFDDYMKQGRKFRKDGLKQLAGKK